MQVSATAQLGQILYERAFYVFTRYLCIFHTLIMQKFKKKLIHELMIRIRLIRIFIQKLFQPTLNGLRLKAP